MSGVLERTLSILELLSRHGAGLELATAATLERGAGKEVVGDYTLPRGTIVLASTLAMHRSERWWADADRFVPTRWLTADGEFDESAPGQPKGAWFPFGFGNRRCIGEQFAWTFKYKGAD